MMGCYRPLEARMASFGTMKTTPWEGSFQVTPSSGCLGSVSEVHGIFSNRSLPSTSWGWQQKAMAITYNFGSVSEKPD